MADPYRDLPDDFKIPLFPETVKLPIEMRAYWLGKIQANAEVVEELERLLKLAKMIRDRSILNARITSDVTVQEIAEIIGVSSIRVHQLEEEQRKKAAASG